MFLMIRNVQNLYSSDYSSVLCQSISSLLHCDQSNVVYDIKSLSRYLGIFTATSSKCVEETRSVISHIGQGFYKN
jgi:hypothetical protein